VKLVYFTDAHIRGGTPKSRIDDYARALWDKFAQLTSFIQKNKVEAALNGGDLFDIPDPSTGVVNKYIKLFASWDIPIYSVTGSHDKFAYNDSTISRTALGTLIASNIVQLIDNTVQLTDKFWVTGVSHSYDLDESPKIDYFKKKPAKGYMIQLCHGMITEKPYFGKYTLYSQIQTEADLVLTGHYHPGFGPYDVSGSTILNIGSMGRVERTERKYDPGFLYIDSNKRTYKFIPFQVQANPFITKTIEDPKTVVDIQTFIACLKDKVNTFGQVNLKELILAVGKEKNMPLSIIKRAIEYIENE